MNKTTLDIIEYFNVRGTYEIAPAALQFVRESAQVASAALPGTNWAFIFEWCFERKERLSKDSPWIDQGPGLDLGGYPVDEIPEACVQHVDGVAIAAKIPANILAAAPNRTIDIEPGDPPKFRLI